jgi:prepilin-type N-terminal cleavage/methylation domain-containing protein
MHDAPSRTSRFCTRCDPCRSHRCRAFTFAEVLVVIVVLGVVAAVILPRMGTNNASKLVAAAQVVMGDMSYAQVDSISFPDDLRRIVIEPGGTSYYLALASAPTTPITNPVTKLPYRTTFGSDNLRALSGVTISSYSLNSDAILIFGMYGELDQTSAATITLSCGSNTLTLTINATTGIVTVGAVQ